jgi:hypothetical protein
VLQIGRLLVPSQMVSLDFSVGIVLPIATMTLGVDTASDRNEYQEYFLGVNATSA